VHTKGSAFRGTVEIRRDDGSSAPLDAAGTLRPGDAIETGTGAGATVQLPDGAKLDLGPGSSFTLLENAREYLVKSGTLRWATHMKKAVTEGRYRRRLLTPAVVAAVRGTDFVLHTEKTRTRLLVFSGEVELEFPGEGEKAVIRSGQKVAIEKGKPPADPQGLTDAEYLQWRTYIREGL